LDGQGGGASRGGKDAGQPDGAVVLVRDESVSDHTLLALEVVNEDLVLGSFRVTVDVVVDGGALGVGWVGHVVSFRVGPIHGLEGLPAHRSGVAPVGVQVATGFAVAANGGNGFSNHTLGRVGHVALERGHVHLVGATDRVVDPEPATDALAVGAGGEIRNVERLEGASNAIVGDRDNDKFIGLDIGNVGFVGNSDGTPGNVGTLGSVQVRGLLRTSVGPGIGGNTARLAWAVPQTATHGGECFVGAYFEVNCSTSG